MYTTSFAITILSLLVLQNPDTNAKRTLECIQTAKPRLGPPANRALEYRVSEERMQVSRFDAVEQLAKFGEDAVPALPILTQLILDRLESKKFKLLAIKAIGCMGPTTPSSLPALTKLLGSGDQELRQAAQGAIDRIESLPKLLEDLSAQDVRTQIEAANSLSEFGSAAFPSLVRVYMKESSSGEVRKESLDSMVRAIERFDFGPREVQSLLGDLNDSRYRLGVDLLVQLISSPNGRSRGEKILNHSSKFDGPTLVRSLLFSDRLTDGTQIGIKLIEMLERDCREIATAVASDTTRFKLATRTQAALIAAKAGYSATVASTNGQLLLNELDANFLAGIGDGANQETIAVLLSGLTTAVLYSDHERTRSFSKALSRQQEAISRADDYSFLLLLDAYSKSSNDESKNALWLCLRNFLATHATSKELLLELLASDSMEHSTFAQKIIRQRKDRYSITEAELKQLPETLVEERLSTEGNAAVFSPDSSYVAVWSPTETPGFFGGGGYSPAIEVRVYQTGTGQLIINGGKTHIAPTFSHDGRYLAVAADESTSVWDLALKRVHLQFPALKPTSVAFLDRGRLIQCNNFELMSWGDPPAHYLHFWDTTTGMQLKSDKLPPLFPAAMSEQGTMLTGWATFADNNQPELRVWNVATGAELARIDLPVGEQANFGNYSCKFSADLNFLEIFRFGHAGDSKCFVVNRFILFDLSLKRIVEDISIPEDRNVIGFQFRTWEDTPFSDRYSYSPMFIWGLPYPICINDEQEIEFWDSREGIVLRSISVSKSDSLQAALQAPVSESVVGCLLPDNQVLIRKGADSVLLDRNNVELEKDSWRRLGDFPSPFNGTDTIYVSPADGSVVLTDVLSGKTIRQIPVGRLRNVWLSKNNEYAVVLQENQVRVWRLGTLADLLR